MDDFLRLPAAVFLLQQERSAVLSTGTLESSREGGIHNICVQDLGFQVWIMGVVSGCALGVSFVLAVVYLCVTIFSGASRHYRFISTPAAYALKPCFYCL